MTPHQSEMSFAMNMATNANLTLPTNSTTRTGFLLRNLAIGTVLPLECILPQCDTLLRSVITLQC